MISNSVASDFKGYNLRYLDRFVFSKFKNAGIDQFTDPPSSDSSKFLSLTNLLPAVSGGFQRRWGITANNVVSSLPNRLYSYQAKADASFAGTQDTYLILGARDSTVLPPTMNVLLTEVNGTPPFNVHFLVPAGAIRGVTSREWFYAATGHEQGQKVNYSQRSKNTSSNWGIGGPAGQTTTGLTFSHILYFDAFPATGVYTSTPTVAISGGGGTGATATPVMKGQNVVLVVMNAAGSQYPTGATVTFSGGGGTGATGTVQLGANGAIESVTITNSGTGYTSAPTVTFSTHGIGGSTAIATAVINSAQLGITDFKIGSGGSGYTSVPTVTVSGGGGPTIQAVAMLGVNGFAGDAVGEIYTQGAIQLPAPRQYTFAWGSSISGHTSDICYSPASATSSSTSGLSGFDRVCVTLVSQPLDGQVDTLQLLSTSAGGDLQHLYGVTTVSPLPLTSGLQPATILNYTDTLPDSTNSFYTTGPTLLSNDLWTDVDASGNPIGIALNTPPPLNLVSPVVSQGRMFMTDGNSIYYSKSIDEVTTSTGLITSKWEEAWPGDNLLDLVSDNEKIVGMLSANGVVYIGTTQNIIMLTGSSATDFSAQVIFHNTGLLSPELWTLVYKENMPVGMMWVTPDLKIMFSDFSSYTNVGLGIYPILQASDFAVNGTNLASYSLQSLSYGPHAFVAMNFMRDGFSQVMIFDVEGGGWYSWGSLNFGTLPGPILSYTNILAQPRLYMICQNSTSSPVLSFFDPTSAIDAALGTSPAVNISWSAQTTWLDLLDPTAYKVLNEVEVWTTEPTTTVTVYGANTTSDFTTQPVIRTGPIVQSPLGAYKMYLAGAASKARYYSFLFACGTPGTTSRVLDQFSVEAYTMSRL